VDSQNRFSGLVLDREPWIDDRPILFYGPDHCPRGRMDLHGLKATWEAAALTVQGSIKVNDFRAGEVADCHVKGAQRSAHLPRTAICVLLGHEDLLAEGVLDLVLVVGLEPCKSLKDFNCLLYKQLVYLRKVL